MLAVDDVKEAKAMEVDILLTKVSVLAFSEYNPRDKVIDAAEEYLFIPRKTEFNEQLL